MAESVYKIIELIGTSSKSSDDAVQQATIEAFFTDPACTQPLPRPWGWRVRR